MKDARSASCRRYTLVLADDHELVRGGIKALLEAMVDVEVVEEAQSGEDLLAVLDGLTPDLVITDLAMPGMDGLAAISRIRERHPRLPVLVVSMYDNVDFVRRAIANGASGYLLKQCAPAELEQAVRTVLATGSYFNAKIARMLLQRDDTPADDGVTKRQTEILVLLARGLSSKEIAYELGLSSKTVDVHRSRIMERLSIRDVAGLTRYAVRKGLISA